MYKSIPILTLITGVAAIAATLFTNNINMALVFDQSTALPHAPWQLLTAHLSHSDFTHLFWNLCGLFVIGSMLEVRSRSRWLLGMAAGLVTINAFLLSDLSTIQFYVGLSGLLNTLLFVLLWQIRHEDRRLALGLALICIGKIIYELWSQQALLTQISWPPYPEAHLAGLLAAIVFISFDLMKAGRLTHLPLLTVPPYSLESSLLAARNSTGCQSWRKEMRRLDP